MGKVVKLHLEDQSEPVLHEDVVNTYEKGSFFCIYQKNEKVYKYPIVHIWRVTEAYGEHHE